MIDSDLIDDLDPEVRYEVRAAFRLIKESGIIESQKERLLAQLLMGSQTEEEAILSNRIREYRKQVGHLQALESLGDRNEEDEHA